MTFAGVKLQIEVVCPDCCSTKVVRNGVKKTGKQNLLCKDCRRQFQCEYRNKGSDPQVKEKLVKMLVRGSGIRDCMAVLGVSFCCVLATILREGKDIEIKPKRKIYRSVQIDEQWSYVGKKEKKVWMIYALCIETGEILAASWGKRNKTGVRRLMMKLKKAEIESYCTDNWQAFAEVLPKDKHKRGKQFTKKIEGVNTWFRARLRRLARRTTGFSKKLVYHWSMMKIAIKKRNEHTSYI